MVYKRNILANTIVKGRVEGKDDEEGQHDSDWSCKCSLLIPV